MGSFVSPGREIPQRWDRLAVQLAAAGLSLDHETSIRQFSAGFGNLNYLIEIDGVPFVLRRPPKGPIPPGANDMKRESRILAQLCRQYPLAPRAVHFCDDTAVLGAPFFVMDYRPGTVIGGEMPEALSGWKDHEGRSVGAHVGEAMIDNLAALHRVRPGDVGLETLGRPKGFLTRTLNGWMHRLELAMGGQLPTSAGDLRHWLEAHQPQDGEATLIHNDFKLDNMIFDPATLAPVAVIDWDMGTRGPPVYDLAVLLSYWTQADDPQVMHDLGQMPTAGHGFMTRDEAADRYARLSGRALDDMRFFRVLATLRLAGVFAQLHMRFREGGTGDARFAGFGDLAGQLLSFAHEIAQGRRF